MTQINNEHLEFLKEAKLEFSRKAFQVTYRNEDETFIALRTGVDRDCILIFELGEKVAKFVQQIKPVKLDIKVKQEEQ